MKKINKIIFSLVGVFGVLLLPAIVFAQEVEECVEEPLWFSVLEVLGVVIAAIGLYYINKIVKVQSQGALGKAFKYYGVGVISIALAMIYKGVIEIMGIEHGFIHELIYEGFVYLMIIMFAIGSEIAYKVLADISNIVKK